MILSAAGLAGCGEHLTCPRVIYLDGAGWYSGDGPVRKGLLAAGFEGKVDRFNWQGLFGALHDHLSAGRDHPDVPRLARRITELREANPDGRIVVMGLSAGTSLVVYALERLDRGIDVDHVVLLSPSISGRHDLTEALRHVKGRLYATCSPHDSLLPSVVSAGGEGGRPAGQAGFKLPDGAKARQKRLYRKLVNLPWRAEYLAYGWDGGHVSVTSADFIRTAIAPRILDDLVHPLDEPVVNGDTPRNE